MSIVKEKQKELKEDKDKRKKLTEKEKIERSIIKEYRNKIYKPFLKALEKYELIKEGDKIVVCISGGKDSFLLAKCLEEVQKHGKIKFELEYILMNPGYSEDVFKKILENSKKLGIELKIFRKHIFKVVDMKAKIKGTCYICARMRRGSLYEIAEKLGANKIALGHHFSDVIETTLLNVFYGSEFKTMMPKLKSDNFKGLELIRPLFNVHEDNIISWKNFNKLEFISCACPLTDYMPNKEKEMDSKRLEIKNLIKDLKKINPNIEKSIFNSAKNANMDALIGWKFKGNKISFLDEY